jgi:hypothetical protein
MNGKDKDKQQQQHQQQQQQSRRPSEIIAGASSSPVDSGSPTIDYPHPGTLVRPQSTYTSPFPQLVPVSDRRSVDDLALSTPRTQLSSPPKSQGQSPVVEPKKSRGLFERIRSTSRTPDVNPSTPSAAGYSLAPNRRLSRRLQNPPALRTGSAISLDKLQRGGDWQTAPEPRSFLPSPQEHVEDSNELDPYLVQEVDPAETRSSSQEHSLKNTIRSVPSDLEEPSLYTTQDDIPSDHLLLADALQQSQRKGSHHQGQQLSPYPNALGISHDPYSQNFETVSQLSFDTSAEQREDIPVSEHSNGNSPTSNANSLRSEHPNSRTTTATGGQREPSQYSVMAPPGTSQQPRRTADPKQAMQGNPGAPDSRDGANYRQQFAGNSTPTTVPAASPLPTVGGNDYRGGPPQREQFAGPGGERGRSTPPPATERDVNDAYKEICKFGQEMSLWYHADCHPQYKNTKRLKGCTSIRPLKSSSSRIPLPTSDYRNHAHPSTIAST